MELNWNFEEFVAYILIYASYVDLDFSKSEQEYILKRIDQQTFKKIEKVYIQASEYERLKIILDHKGQYYPTIAQKKELLGRINELFNVDGDYSRLEKNLNAFLEKLL